MPRKVTLPHPFPGKPREGSRVFGPRGPEARLRDLVEKVPEVVVGRVVHLPPAGPSLMMGAPPPPLATSASGMALAGGGGEGPNGGGWEGLSVRDGKARSVGAVGWRRWL